MTYIKINDNMYPATINECMVDRNWNNRGSKSITLEMDCDTSSALFVDDVCWSIVKVNEVITMRVDENGDPVLDENGDLVYDTTKQSVETDMSEYCVAGSITDNRNGTVTVKMGKPTDAELLAIIMGGN